MFGAKMNSHEEAQPNTALEILLVDDDAKRVEIFEAGLAGKAILRRISELTTSAVLAETDAQAVDILIISRQLPDSAMIKTIEELARVRPMPVAVFVETELDDLARRAIRAGASGYIVKGLAADRVATVVDVTIERFRLTDALLKELSRSKSDLESRKLIEKAKGLLMEQRGVSEHAAYEALRKMAMARGKPMREIAETIVAISNILP
ncbi:ANTAR domain-containing response regulator [Hyphomonas sp.]|uniref:ANTAR domain-containing response regulator n=2 Tax=Hyphomonas sp. TaxID=87 RepID=UPI0039E26806